MSNDDENLTIKYSEKTDCLPINLGSLKIEEILHTGSLPPKTRIPTAQFSIFTAAKEEH